MTEELHHENQESTNKPAGSAKILEEWFSYYADWMGSFDDIERKRSKRRDMHAFLLLDELMPDSSPRMIGAIGHDIIWLSIDTDTLARVITMDQTRELSCCGVFWDNGELSMFV